MKIEWWLLFLIISVTEGLWKVQKSSGYAVAKKTLKTLLESCYKNDDSSNPIVIFGDFNDFIDGSSIIRIDSSFEAVESSKNSQLFDFKANIVVLIEDTSEKLQSDLKLLKSTKWWNHMSSFFIIIKNNEECKNFKDILTTTWKMNIINSILICSSENTSSLYTLNPFANYAPYPWKKIEDLDNLYVFRQFFNANVSCKYLKYDKTRNLHGYKIEAMAPPPLYAENRSGDDSLRPDVLFCQAMIKALNATYNLEYESRTDLMMQHLENNNLDISLWLFALNEYPKKLAVFPYTSNTILAIVQWNPEIPTLHKIFHMWSPPVLVGASIVLATFFTILTIIYRNCSSAMLDLTRLLTYVSIRLDNRSHAFRIYFTTILILIVISNGVFQGRIAAYLTKPERFPAIKTIDQLIELGYKFYTYEESEGTMELQCPKCNITSVPFDDCIYLVRNTTLNVCIIDDASYYYFNWSQFEVEPIKNPLTRVYWKHLCRDDWPLHNRVNEISSVIMESGLSKFWEENRIYRQVQKRQARDRELDSAHYRPVKLVKLDFAFKLLILGLFLSLGCFFIEQLVADYRNP